MATLAVPKIGTQTQINLFQGSAYLKSDASWTQGTTIPVAYFLSV